MANSDSEDFESADEEVLKFPENGNNILYHVNSETSCNKTIGENSNVKGVVTKSFQQLSISSNLQADKSSCTVQTDLATDPSKELSLMPQVVLFNPDSLGAKPKVLPRNKKSCSVECKGLEKTLEAEVSVIPSVTKSSNKDRTLKRRSYSSKLGVKVSPQSDPTQMLFDEGFRVKESVAMTWADVSPVCMESKDSHESIQPLLDKLTSLEVLDASNDVADKSSSGWGAWGSWGMNTIMSGASSVTSHVSQGLSTVSSVIESGLGAVDPQEMARISVEAKKSASNVEDPGESSAEIPSDQTTSGFNVMGTVLRFVESTGEMIVASGLNTLESIGKKTMDVLQEGDPGLKKKRSLFLKETDKPTLSQVLKEARNKADVEDKEIAQAKNINRVHFETLFDDYKGMIHLEALEMLSNTCQLKLEAKLLALSGTSLVEFQRKIIHIKEQCDIPDDDEDEDEDDCGSIEVLERDLAAAMQGLLVPVSHSKLIQVSEDTDEWLAAMKCIQDEGTQSENDHWIDEDEISLDAEPQNALREIHQQAIRALARFTAAVAEHFHKTAELLLLKEEHDSSVECQSIVVMTSVLCSRVSSVAARFSELLSASANVLDSTQVDHNDVNLLITNVFLEASNSSSYIQDASMLLIPVLQLVAVQ